jgi:hypothetical protein
MNQNKPNQKNILLSLMLLLALVTTACSGIGVTATEPVNTQATIDAAVAATANAEAAAQAAVDAAVEATRQAETAATALALPEATATPEPTARPTQVVEDTPTPTAEELAATEAAAEYQLSEEEMIALIDQAVNEAVYATNQYSQVAYQAGADSVVTSEEVQTVEVYVDAAEVAIATAEELLYLYYDIYGGLYYDLAVAAVNEVDDLAAALEEVADAAEDINQALLEIDETLEAGLELAEDVLDQLNQSAEAAEQWANELQQQSELWQADYDTILEERLQEVGAVPPSEIPGSPDVALQELFAFVQEAENVAADGQLTADEVLALAQQGANVQAGLEAQGLGDLANAVETVPAIVEQVGRGDLAEAAVLAENLGAEAALGTPPTEVVQDLRSILGQTIEFAGTNREAMADGSLTPEEMGELARDSANLRASLSNQENPRFSDLSGNITDATEFAGRGDIDRAWDSIDRIDRSVGEISRDMPELELPSFERPEIEKPSFERPEIEKPSIERPSRGD